ncbi:MAG: pyruvate kinase [Bacteroidales bacterium]|nr:pyruvate kinase [Bacteroidales bacterium]
MKPTSSKTKIVATIGPATSSKDKLKELILAGVDVCRLNFSHGSYNDHAKVIQTVRELNKELNTEVALLVDLQGPKLRIGDIENNQIFLKDGEEFCIVTTPCIGNEKRAYLTYEQFPQDVNEGEEILIDDGKIRLRVLSTNRKDSVVTKIINGGILSSHKGVNLPDTAVSLPCLTEKDIEDLEFALSQNIDWIGLSFVRRATDIIELKERIKKAKAHSFVVAKIEKPEALKELDNIIDLSDGIMVARGDLGVEISFDKVPLIQKQIVKKCLLQAKPVIIATQMLESMISTFRPTRAEATDIANAVLDGADALMLSGETSVGKFPIEAVRAMQSIINFTEETAYNYYKYHPTKENDRTFLSDNICVTACKLAQQACAKAIVVFSHSGYTAYQVASYRPKADIYIFTNNDKLLPKLSLLWGAKLYYAPTFNSIDDAVEEATKKLIEQGLVKNDDVVVFVGSTPIQAKGRTNMVKLTKIMI